MKDSTSVIQASKLMREDSPYKLALLPQCQYLACTSVPGATPMLFFIYTTYTQTSNELQFGCKLIGIYKHNIIIIGAYK